MLSRRLLTIKPILNKPRRIQVQTRAFPTEAIVGGIVGVAVLSSMFLPKKTNTSKSELFELELLPLNLLDWNETPIDTHHTHTHSHSSSVDMDDSIIYNHPPDGDV